MNTATVGKKCPRCGVMNQWRVTATPITPGLVVVPTEVAWCSACGQQIVGGAS